MHLQNDHGCMGHVATDVCFVYTRPPWKSIVMFLFCIAFINLLWHVIVTCIASYSSAI